MNREIKFRVWNGKEIEMFTLDNDFDCISGWLKDSTLMQFTGLKDRAGEGQDVYEGDIFEVVFSDTPNGFSRLGSEPTIILVKAIVVFIFGAFHIEFMHPTINKVVFVNLSKFLKNDEKVVLGNVYENTEIIEK